MRGGIPVSEVQDDYIQETLNGMDVSCVFVKKDNNYYEFKPEIKTKEDLRIHLSKNDKLIIRQFERWWDKYRVSLYQIDAQIKKSEEDLFKYLKELGYE